VLAFGTELPLHREVKALESVASETEQCSGGVCFDSEPQYLAASAAVARIRERRIGSSAAADAETLSDDIKRERRKSSA
jgi:hypothetical protein